MLHARPAAARDRAVLFAAAEAAGPEGRVTGIDLASEMVRETAFDVRRRGLGNVAVEVMDGEQPSFAPGTFDAVVGSFSNVLLPHAVEALPRYGALLREGGVLAFSGPSFEGDGSFPFTWSSLPRTLIDLFDDVLQRMGGQDVVQSTMGWVAGADRIRESLAGAGFAGVAIHEERSPRSSGPAGSGCELDDPACGSCGRRCRRRTGRAWRHGSRRRSRAGAGRTGRSPCQCRCGSSWRGDARPAAYDLVLEAGRGGGQRRYWLATGGSWPGGLIARRRRSSSWLP